MKTLVYLYGVVPGSAPAPPAELRGVDGGSVRLVLENGVAAVVSDVAAADYVEEVLEARLSDLAWIGERGLAHERVLTWYVDRGPVVPLSPFSLHADEERVRARIQEDVGRLTAALARLAGRQEWGVKVWRRDAELRPHLEALSPRLHAVAAEVRSAPPGKRFLLEKKHAALQQEELRKVSASVLQQVFESLRARAEAAVRLPIARSETEAERVLGLHSAFLVDEEAFSDFQQALSELAAAHQPRGFEFEFTGPWPPYHFVERDAP